MGEDYYPFFSFNSTLEFEKKTYHLAITLFYNRRIRRKEYQVVSSEFTGSFKLLVHNKMTDSQEKEWVDINNQDNSSLIQELGEVIYRANI
jgi:hypothetical protein